MVVGHFGKDPSSRPFSGLCCALCGKNIVAAGLADRCEIQLSYAIGVAEPTSIMGRNLWYRKSIKRSISWLVREFFDLRPLWFKMLNFNSTNLSPNCGVWTLRS